MKLKKQFKEAGPFGRLFHRVTEFQDCGETYVVYKYFRKRKRYWEYEAQHEEIWKMRQGFAKQFKKELEANKSKK